LYSDPYPDSSKYEPLVSSFPKYSFTQNEKEIIDNLRKWSDEYFRTTLIFDPETKMPTEQAIAQDGKAYYKDFDILGKIIKAT
jgi:hypothetical protein